MVNAISSSAVSYIGAASQTAAVQAIQPVAATKTAKSAAPQTDTVQLSPAAQAHAMQQQGMTVKTIAANMGITTQAVNTYLGISSLTTAGGGQGASAQLKKIASEVRVNPPASGNES